MWLLLFCGFVNNVVLINFNLIIIIIINKSGLGAGSLFVADVVFYDVRCVCVGVLVLFVCVAIGFVGISCVSRYFAWCCVLVSGVVLVGGWRCLVLRFTLRWVWVSLVVLLSALGG